MRYFLLLILSSQLLAQNMGAFDTVDPMSADELHTSETYVHEGRNEREYNEACQSQDKYKDICTNKTSAFRSKDMQQLEQYMPIVSKVFSMVVGTINLTAGGGASAKASGDSQADYCGKIAMAMELGSMVLNKQKGDKTNENLKNTNSKSKQAKSFEAVATTQKDLRNSSRLQMGGWAATAACYGAMAATGQTQTDTKLIVKLGGAVAMGTFYGYKQSYHNKRYKKLMEMAKGIPGRGNCNPVTETTCFCSEETSPVSDAGNYQKYCIPQILANRPGDGPAVCVTATGVADPNCNCKLTNSCITHKVGSMGLKLGFDGNQLQSLIKGISPLGLGFVKSDFQKATDKNMAFAKSQLKKAPGLKSDPNLTKAQKSLASFAAKMGIPKSVAASIAKLPSSGLPANIANINSGEPKASEPAIEYNKVASYKKGGSNKKRRGKNSRGFNPFARKKKAKGTSAGIEINNDYIARAQREAEITKDTSKPIFDIISYRYKKSAWKQYKSSLEEEK